LTTFFMPNYPIQLQVKSMDDLKEIPERCDHPLAFIELYRTRAEQTRGGAWVHDALVHCHRCGAEFHICSDFGDRWEDIRVQNVPILRTARV